MNSVKEGLCEVCQKGEIMRSSHKLKTQTSVTKPLHLIHMDLFGPVNVLLLGRKNYAFVMVHNFFRYTLVEFLSSKDGTPQLIIDYVKKVDKESQEAQFVTLRCDNGIEFRNAMLYAFYKTKNPITKWYR